MANGISHVLFVSIDHAGSFNATPNRSDDDLIWPGGLQVSFLVLDLSTGETVEGGVEQAVTSATFHPKSGDLDRHQVKVINDEAVNT